MRSYTYTGYVKDKLLTKLANLIVMKYMQSLLLSLDASRPLPPEQCFYTTDEVAKLLKVDPENVRRYVRSNYEQTNQLTYQC